MSTAAMSDVELQHDVIEEWKWEPSVNAAHIGVTVKNGVVTLTGHVPSYAEKFAAERAANRVAGVRAVANELDVKLPSSQRRTDEDITIADVLESNSAVPADTIRITVSNGWVKLEGEVERNYQKIAAEAAIRNLSGVTDVTNLIVVRPSISPTELEARVEAALRRDAELDARRITVEVEGSEVILRGTVRSWAEREEAAREA